MSQRVELIVSCVNDTRRALQEIMSSFQSLAMKFAVWNYSIQSGFNHIKKAFDEFAEAAERQEKRFAFTALAASVNRNATQIISDVRTASGEMLSIQDTIETTGKAMLLGLDPKTITRLMEIARASAKVTGQTISAAFNDITLGVARQSKMILDNLGILVDYDRHLKRIQSMLGKTESELTDVERKQAFLNATMEAGQEIVDRVGMGFQTLNERLNIFKATVADSVNQVKDYLLGISAIDAAIGASRFGLLSEQYGKQKEELDKLIPKYNQLKESVQAMLEGKEAPRPYILQEFEKLEGKVISLQKGMNAIARLFGGEQIGITEKLITTPGGEEEKGIAADRRKWLEWEWQYADAVDRAGQEILDNLERRDHAIREHTRTLQASREAEIQLQIKEIDLAEQEFRISKSDAIRKRLELYSELKRIQEEYLANLDKEKDPSSWYAQINAINETREALLQLNLELKKQTGAFVEGAKFGFQEYIHNAKTAFEYGIDMARASADAIENFFSTISFDAMQGKLKSLGDYFKSFLSSIQQAISQILGQLAVQGIIRWVSGFSMTTASVPIMVHQGGYIPRFHFGGLAHDEIPAILQRGEYVISRKGVDMLDKINSGHGIGETVIVQQTVQFNVSAIDSRDADRFFKENEGRIKEMVAKGIRNSRSFSKRIKEI